MIAFESMNDEKEKLKAAEAIIELHSIFNDLNNFKEIPVVLEKVLKNYIHIDWLAFYQNSQNDFGPVTTNKSLPFNWGELYQAIAKYDTYRDATNKLLPGKALLAKEFHNPSNETENYCFEYAKKHTGTVDCLTMPTINTPQELIGFGFYSTDKKNLFTRKNKAFIEQISPILISVTNIMMLYREFDLQRTAFDNLIKSQNGNYIILNNKFKTIDFSAATLNFFQEIFENKNLNDLPDQIKSYIDDKLSQIRLTAFHQEPRTHKLNLKLGTLIIYTYQIEKYYLMKFIFQKNDLFNEKTLPLTNMENKILQLLKKGFIVKEIADQLNLSERGVNFHKYNIVKKLRVSNIAEAISVLADYGI